LEGIDHSTIQPEKLKKAKKTDASHYCSVVVVETNCRAQKGGTDMNGEP
jgi:hypothetical protein